MDVDEDNVKQKWKGSGLEEDGPKDIEGDSDIEEGGAKDTGDSDIDEENIKNL